MSVSTRARPHDSELLRAGDSGMSLIEVVTAIGLLGVVVVAMLTTISTVTRVSAQHRIDVSSDQMLRATAESILSKQTPYVDCATPSSYMSAIPDDPNGRVVVTVESVEVWDGASPPSYSLTCGTDPGAALITLQATKADGTQYEELQIVKRRSAP